MGVRVEVEAFIDAAAADMDHRHAIEGKGGEELARHEAAVACVRIGVGDVEQESAPGRFDDRVVEVALGHRRGVGPDETARSVLEHERDSIEVSSHAVDVPSYDLHRLPSERQLREMANLA